jgi:hypothetical protein
MGAGLSRGSAAGRWYGPPPTRQGPLRVPAGPAAPALDPRAPAPAGPGQGEAAVCCKRARPRKGRPTSLIRDIRDRDGASGGTQTYGNTDEIIQWVSCKWGFDTDAARAQAIVESNWVAFSRTS